MDVAKLRYKDLFLLEVFSSRSPCLRTACRQRHSFLINVSAEKDCHEQPTASADNEVTRQYTMHSETSSILHNITSVKITAHQLKRIAGYYKSIILIDIMCGNVVDAPKFILRISNTHYKIQLYAYLGVSKLSLADV